MKKTTVFFAALALLCWSSRAVFVAKPAVGQEATTQIPSQSVKAATSTTAADFLDRSTPRSAVTGLLHMCHRGIYELAPHFLGLRNAPTGQRAIAAADLARQLCIVIERAAWIDPETLSDSPEGDKEDGLPSRQELVASLATRNQTIRLLLERVPSDEGTLVWKVASATLVDVPKLYQELGDTPFERYLPPTLVHTRLLTLPLWQWIGILFLWVCAYVLAWALSKAAVRFGGLVLPVSWQPLGAASLRTLQAPLRWLVAVQIFAASVPWLRLSVRANAMLASLLGAVTWFLLAWLSVRTVDLAARMIAERASNRQALAALLPLGQRAARTLVIVLVSLAALQNLGFNVTSVLAGLGIGGVAVALASQRTLEHVFGGVTLVADQPLRVGEFCRFGEKMGTVVDIGLRSTWVRTPERTLLAIPNGQLASMQIENFSRRDSMRFETTLSIHHEVTAEQLRLVLQGLREALLRHPKTIRDTAEATIARVGARSFDLEVSVYLRTTDPREFRQIREDLLLEFVQVVQRCGARLAFN